ncbi:hypothetical protein VPH35_121180 [Triticum aestivum]
MTTATNHSRSTIILAASLLRLSLSAATFRGGRLPICDGDGDGSKELDLLNTLAQQRDLLTGGAELLCSVECALLQLVPPENGFVSITAICVDPEQGEELDLFSTSSSWVAVAKDSANWI